MKTVSAKNSRNSLNASFRSNSESMCVFFFYESGGAGGEEDFSKWNSVSACVGEREYWGHVWHVASSGEEEDIEAEVVEAEVGDCRWHQLHVYHAS